MKADRDILFLTLLLLITSCKQPKELVYKNVQNFNIRQVDLQNLGKAKLSMDVRLYNPNSYSLKLKKSNVDVYLNGSLLGKINTVGGIDIAKLDTSSLPVTLDVDLGRSLPNLLQLALFDKDVSIKLSGSIKAGRHGMFIKVPVNYEGKQDILGGIKMNINP